MALQPPDCLRDLYARVWQEYNARRKDATCAPHIVLGSAPVLYFGDHTAYSAEKGPAQPRVVTVGLNPSGAEFPRHDSGSADGFYSRRFPTMAPVYAALKQGSQSPEYGQALNKYFYQQPLEWFDCYEHILRGIGASFHIGTGRAATHAIAALHTDICTPLATVPTWAKKGKDGTTLPSQVKKILEPTGGELWRDLIQCLAPDIILISVAASHLEKIKIMFQPAIGDKGTICTTNWKCLYNLTISVNGAPFKTPYVVSYRWISIPDSTTSSIKATNSLVVFGPANVRPFLTVPSNKKPDLGKEILRVWLTGPCDAAPAMS